jgi:peptidoglycan hydrolase-like protein with peptidoglycan-binding domain
MRFIAVIVASSLFLASCGSSTKDRALSGAGIGAAAGTVLGAVTGLTLLQGVVIGAVSGGLIGGLTNKSTIDLGDPVWARGEKPANHAAVSRVQASLNRLGYASGPTDGVLGPKTRTAIESYQRKNGMTVDGRPTEALAQRLDGQLKLASKG